jgi:hypothetical protein
MLPVSLDFPFLIALSVFSNVYLQSRQNKKESMTSLVGNVLSAKWKIQRNWQHGEQHTKKNKTKTQHNMCWTPLYGNKHIHV